MGVTELRALYFFKGKSLQKPLTGCVCTGVFVDQTLNVTLPIGGGREGEGAPVPVPVPVFVVVVVV